VKIKLSLRNNFEKLPEAAARIVGGVLFEIASVRERDPAAHSDFEILLLYPGLHALFVYRIAHVLHKHGYKFTARLLSQAVRTLTGIEIHPAAKIGRGLFIDHGAAVVIGETAEIGDNCTLYQGVTLGGNGKETEKRHPTLGDNVMVGAGAKILGGFKIGSNSKIAANAVVLGEVPENSTAVGIPARIVKRNGQKVKANDLDHIHIPDPVAQQICHLERKIAKLENELNKINQKGNDVR